MCILNDAEEKRGYYFDILSRGGLTVPSSALTDDVVHAFAILDTADNLLQSYSTLPVSLAAEEILEYNCNIPFACEDHSERAIKLCRRILVNVFFNNKQKIVNDSIQKDALTSFKKRQRCKDN